MVAKVPKHIPKGYYHISYHYVQASLLYKGALYKLVPTWMAGFHQKFLHGERGGSKLASD